ncbi:hypothetical protein BH09ACT10_BH09ACT10_10980 [soil metagenome]
MVTFTHREAGTAESRWLAAEPWMAATPLDLSGIDHLVVAVAHPDDETLGAGGLIATAHARGIPVTVVVASDGDASHPESPTTTPRQLARLRRLEVTQAVGCLAASAQLHFLGMPDGELEAHTQAIADVLESVLTSRAGSVLLISTWSEDRHPDHQSVAVAARTAALRRGATTVLAAPIWTWHWSAPDDDDIPWDRAQILFFKEAARDAKIQALGCHVSQTEPLSDEPGDEPILTPAFLAHFERPFELFVETLSPVASLPPEFFDDFYRDERDPWGFETRWYEQRKRAACLAALPKELYVNALEIGCSIGVLTEQLAARTEALLATDIAEAPLRVAQQRLSNHEHVRFEQCAVPDEWPEGTYDLIVVSEVGYYLDRDALAQLVSRISESLTPDGTALVCHWRRPVAEYPLTGTDVHDAFRSHPALVRTVEHTEADFLLEIFRPAPAWSVAEETGLV